jgi:hypothetical protein
MNGGRGDDSEQRTETQLAGETRSCWPCPMKPSSCVAAHSNAKISATATKLRTARRRPAAWSFRSGSCSFMTSDPPTHHRRPRSPGRRSPAPGPLRGQPARGARWLERLRYSGATFGRGAAAMCPRPRAPTVAAEHPTPGQRGTGGDEPRRRTAAVPGCVACDARGVRPPCPKGSPPGVGTATLSACWAWPVSRLGAQHLPPHSYLGGLTRASSASARPSTSQHSP